MQIDCPKCKVALAEVLVITPVLVSCHCGMCGHEFGVSLRPEEKAAASVGLGEGELPGEAQFK